MAKADDYAKWLVDNADKKGTDDFNTVVKAYQEAKTEEDAANNPAPDTSSPESDSMATQAATIAARPVADLGLGAVKTVINAPLTALTYPFTHPITTAKTVVDAAERMIPQVPTYIDHGVIMSPGTRAMTVGEGLMAGGRGLAALAASPESIAMMPYSMAGYEQAKIRANPTAPEYKTNPYAMAVRGEYPTQGAAGAANQRQALINMPNGPLNAQEQAVMDKYKSDQLQMAIRLKAARKVLGQP
jgi:hypothetical protein